GQEIIQSLGRMHGRDERRGALHPGIHTRYCHPEGRAETRRLRSYASEADYEGRGLREVGRCLDGPPLLPLLPTCVLGKVAGESENEGEGVRGDVLIVDAPEVR